MADFHSSDGWFVWGIITIILHLVFVSGWHRLRHVLYSRVWLVFSSAQVIQAVLSIILHSKRSSPPLLLATALWSLVALVALILAIARSFLRIIDVLKAPEKRTLRYLQWTQYLSVLALPFFVSSTACWAHSATTKTGRVHYRNAGRALNRTGGSLLLLDLAVSVLTGCLISAWSLSKKSIKAPLSTATYGLLLSAPFAITRLAVQMYWMRFRNSAGASLGLHVGGGVAMDLIVPTINLAFAFYTFGSTTSEAFLKLYQLQSAKPRSFKTGHSRWSIDSTVVNSKDDRRMSVTSTLSAASASTAASLSRAMSIGRHGRTDRVFPVQFTIKTTGRVYKLDLGDILIRNVKRVHKNFTTRPDLDFKQSPFCLNPVTVRADARRVVCQIAKLLQLFSLWELGGGGGGKATPTQHMLETDILSIWYGDFNKGQKGEAARSDVSVMRPFGEIHETVCGPRRRQQQQHQHRPLEKMLARVFLHFFGQLEGHAPDSRAALCLFALRLMRKRELVCPQPFEPTFVDAAEGLMLGVDEGIWRRFDDLAAGRHQQTFSSSSSSTSATTSQQEEVLDIHDALGQLEPGTSSVSESDHQAVRMSGAIM